MWTVGWIILLIERKFMDSSLYNPLLMHWDIVMKEQFIDWWLSTENAVKIHTDKF